MLNLLLVLLLFVTPQKDVTVQKAAALMKKKNVVVLDVRTKAEQDSGYIKKAVFIDYNQSNFLTKVHQLDKSKTYIVYCRSGRKSAETQAAMDTAGFKHVYYLQGGIIEWKKWNLPVDVPTKH